MATKVKIGDKEYTYSFNLGAMMNYERMSAEMGGNLTGSEVNAVMHYACLLTDKTFTMSSDDFLASIDSLEKLEELNAACAAEQARWGALNTKPDADADELKKK